MIVAHSATRKPLLTALAGTVWLLNIQYFIIQIIVARHWAQSYSLLHNTISDLGNTACGPYGNGFVCSPLHQWMNLSFLALGVGMVLGAALIYLSYKHLRGVALAGLGCMVLAGVGTMLVGLFPENTVSTLHILGASLPFTLGNVALVILGCTLPMPRVLRAYTLSSGFVALVALALFFTHTYLGLGIGGTERLTAYPQTIWLLLFSPYVLFRITHEE